jgi:PAS domain S-box-containing protein
MSEHSSVDDARLAAFKLLDRMNQAVLMLDGKGTVLQLNLAAAKLEDKNESWKGKNIVALFFEREHVVSFSEILAEGRTPELDYRWVTETNKSGKLEHQAFPHGEGYLWTFRKLEPLEHQLQVKSEYIRQLEESAALAKVGSWEVDFQHGTLHWSKETRRIHGFTDEPTPSPAEAISYFVDEQARDRLNAETQRITTHGGSYEIEARLKPKKGPVVWVRIKAEVQLINGICTQMNGFIQDITEYKNFEQTIVETKTRLERVLESTEVGAWEWNIQTGTCTFNDRWAAMLGYTLAELEPLHIDTWLSLLNPLDKAVAEETLQAYLAGKTESYKVEFRMKHKDGHWVWIQDEGKIFSYDQDGKPLFMYGTHRDISAEKKVFEELQESQSRSQIIAENLEEMFWLLNAEGDKLLYMNPAYTNFFGLQLEDLYRDPEVSLKSVHPDDLDRVLQVYPRYLQTGVFEESFRVIHTNGQIFWIKAKIRPIYDAQQQLIYRVGTAQDITEIQEHIAALQASNRQVASSNARLAEAQKVARLGFREINHLTESSWWSAELYDLVEADKNDKNISPEEYLKFIHPDDREVVRETMLKHLAGNTPYDLGYRLLTGSGKMYFVRERCETSYDAAGKAVRSLAVIADLTELRTAQQKEKEITSIHHDLLNQVADAFFMCDVEGRFLEVNNESCTMLGYTREELLSMHLNDIDNEYDIEQANKLWNSFKSGDTHTFITTHKHKKGHSIPVEIRFGITMRDGQRVVLGLARDITDRIAKENEIRQSQARFKTLLESAPIGIGVLQLPDAAIFINQQFTELTGYTIDDTSSFSKWWELLYPDPSYRAEVRAQWEQALFQTPAGEQVAPLVCDVTTKAGPIKQMQISAVAVGNEIIFAFVDLSDLIQARQEAEKQENFIRLVMDSLPIGIAVNSIEPVAFRYMNDNFPNYYGVTREDLKEPDNFWEAVYPDKAEREQMQKRIVEDVKSGLPERMRWNNVAINRPGEKTRYINASNTLIPDQGYQISTVVDVTESVTATQKLHQSNEQIRKLSQAVEQSTASIVITDLDGNIEYVNPAFTTITGYTLEEAKGKNPRILTTGQKSKEEYKLLWDTIKSGQVWQGEFYNKRKDGSFYWEAASISPIRDENGLITHFLAVKEDISLRKKYEEELQQSEEKYRLLAENATDVIWIMNLNQRRFTYVSPAVTQLIGHTVEQTLAMNFETMMSAESYVRALELIEKSVMSFQANPSEPVTGRIEIQQYKADGSLIWVELSMRMYLNGDGELEVIGVTRDIAQRKEIEALQLQKATALHDSEQRFRALFSNNASPMYLFDFKTGQLVDVNPAAESFYGWAREQFLLRNVRDQYANPEEVEDRLSRLAVDKRFRFETKHTKSDGTRCDVEIFSSLIQLGGQTLVHSIVHDISKRNEYFDALIAQNKILKEIARVQSHEVRAPLARLMALIMLIEDESFTFDPNANGLQSDKEVLQEILKSAYELDGIIRSISEKNMSVHHEAIRIVQ